MPLEYRIVHRNGSTSRVTGQEFFGNLDSGNLIKKDRRKYNRRVTFSAHVLPGLIAVKHKGQPLEFRRHFEVDHKEILSRLLLLGCDPEEAAKLAMRFISDPERKRTV